MLRYLTIRDGLYLVEQPIAKAKDLKKDERLNHIWIYDRSGSMSSLLSSLAKDLIVRAKTLPVGDTITLGWFSGEGQFNFILKGYKITDQADYKILEDTINKNKSSVGCTCFSEVLADTNQVLNDLSNISDSFALCFFTDGYPVVSNYSREIEAIYMAIEKIQGKLTSSLLVGYGNYYNKELMSTMAERLGGALIHSGDLKEFNSCLQTFMDDARENGSKLRVQLEVKPSFGVVFGMNGKQVTLYSPEKGEISFVPTRGEEQDSIYFLTDRAPSGSKEVDSRSLFLKGEDPMAAAAYSTARILTQRTKTDLALEVLSAIGDKYLIDQTNNAFTNTEYGKVESQIQHAAFHKADRFSHGKQVNYYPKADAFCLLDALKVLMADDQSYFYPYHDDFAYSRIGSGSKPKEGYPTFHANKDAKCPLNALTWNDTKLNLSVRAKVPGKVNLQGDYAKAGFQEEYPTFVYRNYALVKDGFLNLSSLPVSLSEEAFSKLQHKGMIKLEDTWKQDGIYLLSLDSVPVINRKIAEGKTSAKDLCRKAFKEIQLEGQIKALKFLRDEIDPDGDSKYGKSSLTKDQELFLEQNGITRNGFAPPTEKLPAVDWYMAKEFEIKIKGLSSLPKVSDVIEKSEKGGKLNTGMQLIKTGLDLFSSNLNKSATDKAKLAWLDQELSNIKHDLINVRSEIQETKFAIILGKRWFDEFTGREKNVISVDGNEYTIAVEETKVEI